VAITPSGVSEGYGPAIAAEGAQIEREIAQTIERQRQKLAAEGLELREYYDAALGKIVQQRVQIAAASRLPDDAKNELRAAQMDELRAKTELARATHQAEEYIRINRLPEQPARWSAEEGGSDRPSGKSEADLHRESYTRPYRAELDRATEHREHAEQRYGALVRALAALEAEEVQSTADRAAEEKRHQAELDRIDAKRAGARLRYDRLVNRGR
jgi:hypothetical protein